MYHTAEANPTARPPRKKETMPLPPAGSSPNNADGRVLLDVAAMMRQQHLLVKRHSNSNSNSAHDSGAQPAQQPATRPHQMMGVQDTAAASTSTDYWTDQPADSGNSSVAANNHSPHPSHNLSHNSNAFLNLPGVTTQVGSHSDTSLSATNTNTNTNMANATSDGNASRIHHQLQRLRYWSDRQQGAGTQDIATQDIATQEDAKDNVNVTEHTHTSNATTNLSSNHIDNTNTNTNPNANAMISVPSNHEARPFHHRSAKNDHILSQPTRPTRYDPSHPLVHASQGTSQSTRGDDANDANDGNDGKIVTSPAQLLAIEYRKVMAASQDGGNVMGGDNSSNKMGGFSSSATRPSSLESRMRSLTGSGRRGSAPTTERGRRSREMGGSRLPPIDCSSPYQPGRAPGGSSRVSSGRSFPGAIAMASLLDLHTEEGGGGGGTNVNEGIVGARDGAGGKGRKLQALVPTFVLGKGAKGSTGRQLIAVQIRPIEEIEEAHEEGKKTTARTKGKKTKKITKDYDGANAVATHVANLPPGVHLRSGTTNRWYVTVSLPTYRGSKRSGVHTTQVYQFSDLAKSIKAAPLSRNKLEEIKKGASGDGDGDGSLMITEVQQRAPEGRRRVFRTSAARMEALKQIRQAVVDGLGGTEGIVGLDASIAPSQQQKKKKRQKKKKKKNESGAGDGDGSNTTPKLDASASASSTPLLPTSSEPSLLALTPSSFFGDKTKADESSNASITVKVSVKSSSLTKEQSIPKGVIRNGTKWRVAVTVPSHDIGSRSGSRYVGEFTTLSEAIKGNIGARKKLASIKATLPKNTGRSGSRYLFASKEAKDKALQEIRKAAAEAACSTMSSTTKTLDEDRIDETPQSAMIKSDISSASTNGAIVTSSEDIVPGSRSEELRRSELQRLQQEQRQTLNRMRELEQQAQINEGSQNTIKANAESSDTMVARGDDDPNIVTESKGNSPASPEVISSKRLPLKKRSSAWVILSESKGESCAAKQKSKDEFQVPGALGNNNENKSGPKRAGDNARSEGEMSPSKSKKRKTLKKRWRESFDSFDATEKENGESKTASPTAPTAPAAPSQNPKPLAPLFLDDDFAEEHEDCDEVIFVDVKPASKPAEVEGEMEIATNDTPLSIVDVSTGPPVILKGNENKAKAFRRMLDEHIKYKLIIWRRSGDCFDIHVPNYTKYLGHDRLLSFLSTLYAWGFQQVRGSNISGSFFHPGFQRDHSDMKLVPVQVRHQTDYCIWSQSGQEMEGLQAGTFYDIIVPRMDSNNPSSSFGINLTHDDLGWTTIATNNEYGWLKAGDRIEQVNGEVTYTVGAMGSPRPLNHHYLVMAAKNTPPGMPLKLRVFRKKEPKQFAV